MFLVAIYKHRNGGCEEGREMGRKAVKTRVFQELKSCVYWIGCSRSIAILLGSMQGGRGRLKLGRREGKRKYINTRVLEMQPVEYMNRFYRFGLLL